MATEKETVILDLKVDQGSAIGELERTKKSIIQLKEEQQALTKAYKAGEVTVEEYANETVRLEAILKKNQSEYNNIQKSVTGVKTQMDKLIDSNKKMSTEFQNAASNIRVAGVSLGDVTTKLASFVNPATAAIAVVASLGAAYARSTIGAKDLEFASNQLSAATTILTNNFASLISSSEDGQGLFSKAADNLLFIVDVFTLGANDLVSQSRKIAQAQEDIDDLQRDEIAARSRVSDILADNQELLTQIQDSQTNYNKKLELSQKAIENISMSEDILLDVKKKQLLQAQIILNGDKLNEDKKRTVLEIEREISNIQKDAARKTAALERQQDNITDQNNKQLEAERKKTEELRKQQAIQDNRINRGLTETDSADLDGGLRGQTLVKTTKTNLDTLDDMMLESARRQEEIEKEKTRVFNEQQEIRFAAASATTAALTTLAVTAFGEGSAIAKITGIADAVVNTYTGATLALRSAPPPLSFALAALTIANGLASVEQISRAAGGGDFVTRGPALMLVGDNPGGRERVTVEPLSGRGQTKVRGNSIAMAGGGTLTTGFDDGGITKNGAVGQMQQALMFTNAIKNLPKPVVGVREFVEVQRGLEVKQSVASA